MLVCALSLTACTKKSATIPVVKDSARDKFLGEWQVNESGGTGGPRQYSVSIAPSGDGASQEVVISKFYNIFTDNVAAYASNDTLYIPVQTVDGYTVFGSGYIGNSATYGTDGVITMSYQVISATTVLASYGYNGNPPSIW